MNKRIETVSTSTEQIKNISIGWRKIWRSIAFVYVLLAYSVRIFGGKQPNSHSQLLSSCFFSFVKVVVSSDSTFIASNEYSNKYPNNDECCVDCYQFISTDKSNVKRIYIWQSLCWPWTRAIFPVLCSFYIWWQIPRAKWHYFQNHT